ncbi:MAG: NapC/NirT family cytochrome c [Planctomycetes bacterium]|nr:NapC/NirT family cytochrome c [Planctomycetota bacterium]
MPEETREPSRSEPTETGSRPTLRWRILGWLGIRRAPERRWGVRFRWKFYFYSVVFTLVAGLAGMSVYSTSPSFCRSCHIMEPYYQGWANSKHHGVACVDCHYPPGETATILWKKFQALSQVAKFVTRTYSSKPYAEVEDASCLRSGCHATRLLQGLVVSEKGVRFDHRPHLEGVRYGRQLRCVSCHSQVVVGKHIEVTWDTCYLCHFKGRQHGRNIEPLGGCLGCHALPSREIKVGNIVYNHAEFQRHAPLDCQTCHQDAVQGEGEVDEDRCRTCHNQPEKLERYKDTPFLHANHVTQHNTACFHCHREMRHGATPAGTRKLAFDCGMCHTDTHDLQRQLYMGTGAKGVEAMPSPMYLANVDCSACHKIAMHSKDTVSKEVTVVGTERGCVDCHGKEYLGIMEEVHNVLRKTIDSLDRKREGIKASLPAGWEDNLDFLVLKQELAEISYNLEFVRQSHAIHNIYYAAQVVRAADERLTSIAKQRKVTGGKTTDDPVISGGFCATMCHGRVGVKVPPLKVTYKGKEMPHEKHFEEMACSTCHVFGQHKEIRLKTPTRCKKCHEEEQD